MSERCELQWSGDHSARLRGPLTFGTVTALYHDLERRNGAGAMLSQLDLSGLSGADSAGLALLLQLQSAARAAGGEIAFLNPPDGLLKLAGLADATAVLGLHGKAET